MTMLWIRRFVASIPTNVVDMIAVGGVGFFVGMGVTQAQRCWTW